VNGSAGVIHSLTWRDCDGMDDLPEGAPGEMVEVPVPLTINVDLSDRVVPVSTSSTTTRTKCEDQSVCLNRHRHQVDLGFAVTYHKIQGQTLDSVVLVLHRRKSRQLLSLCFEMLYVAVTRVRRTSDIRVLFFPGDKGTSGLEHLKKLKRPRLFDEWLLSYDKNGNWDSTELLKQAASDKIKAKELLSRTKPLTSYTVPQLKPIAASLGVTVENAPGKTYPRKAQFLSAIYPVWASLKSSRVIPQRHESSKKNSGNTGKTRTHTKPLKRRSKSTPRGDQSKKMCVREEQVFDRRRGNDSWIGRAIKKNFGSLGFFTGRVDGVDDHAKRKGHRLFHITYSDGDDEWIEVDELSKILMPSSKTVDNNKMTPAPHKRKATVTPDVSSLTKMKRSCGRRNTRLVFDKPSAIELLPRREEVHIARTNRIRTGLMKLYESILDDEITKGGSRKEQEDRVINRMSCITFFRNCKHYTSSLSATQAYSICFPGHFISCDVLGYGLALFCADQHVPFHYLGSAISHDFLFNVAAHEQAPGQVVEMQRRCMKYISVIESGKCLVLPYNYPRDQHWMCVLAWKDNTKNPAVYSVEPRNSLRSYRRYDEKCVQDSIEFLKKAYHHSGVRVHQIPNFKQLPSANVTEQRPGDLACCVHTLAEAFLAAKGCFLTHDIPLTFIDLLRGHLVDQLGAESIVSDIDISTAVVTRPMSIRNSKKKRSTSKKQMTLKQFFIHS